MAMSVFFVIPLVSLLYPPVFLYSLSSIIFSYSFLSSGSVISPFAYAFASSASNLNLAIFVPGAGGGPVSE